jgi:glycerate dehydrogenase
VRGVFLDLASVDNGDLDRSTLAACLPRWDWHADTAAGAVSDRIRGAEIVISNKTPLDHRALGAAGALRLVAVAATGTNNVDLAAAREFGVTVCNIRDYCNEAVAQHAITLLLNLLTGQPWYRDRVRRGDWSASRHFTLHDRPIREARGLALGLIGYGSRSNRCCGRPTRSASIARSTRKRVTCWAGSSCAR